MRELINKLKQEGITENQVDTFKLYNPDTYEKLLQQARFSVDVAVREYKGVIQASNKRV